MAGLGPQDLQLVELHDCFATAEILHYENLGLCRAGEGGRLIDSGDTSLGGRIPVNVSGGLLSKGHPLGATGIANIYEVSTHLRGEAGKRMESNKIPPLAVYLASNSGAKVSGQIFGVRANEIYFFSQPRILRTLHRAEGWTPESIAEQAIPALESNFYENVPSMAITPWDPI
jgi:hypothetical protein